jgi:hypothetical protein
MGYAGKKQGTLYSAVAARIGSLLPLFFFSFLSD